MRAGVLALVLTGCVSIPPFQGETSDGAPAVRLIGNAYRDGGDNGVAHGTSGMSHEGFTIPSTGVVDGDLVIFVGNVDNGVEGMWRLPTDFHVLANHTFGPDGQSYVVAWKIASGEPTLYTGTYLPGITTSAAATVTLLAVTGYDAATPIETFLKWDQPDYANPADIGSPGITTTADNSLLVFASGADWNPEGGTNTFVPPTGFTKLTSFGDRDLTWDWSCQAIATKMQAVAGATGALTGSMAALSVSDNTTPIPGAGWSVVLAIAPVH